MADTVYLQKPDVGPKYHRVPSCGKMHSPSSVSFDRDDALLADLGASPCTKCNRGPSPSPRGGSAVVFIARQALKNVEVTGTRPSGGDAVPVTPEKAIQSCFKAGDSAAREKIDAALTTLAQIQLLTRARENEVEDGNGDDLQERARRYEMRAEIAEERCVALRGEVDRANRRAEAAEAEIEILRAQLRDARGGESGGGEGRSDGPAAVPIVFATPRGKCFHRNFTRCGSMSHRPIPVSAEAIAVRGLAPCRKCKPVDVRALPPSDAGGDEADPAAAAEDDVEEEEEEDLPEERDYAAEALEQICALLTDDITFEPYTDVVIDRWGFFWERSCVETIIRGDRPKHPCNRLPMGANDIFPLGSPIYKIKNLLEILQEYRTNAGIDPDE